MSPIWNGCTKCGTVARLALIATGAGGDFRKCGACGGLSWCRYQPERGRVVRRDEDDQVVEVVGEFTARPEQLEPSWYAAALVRGS